ncbi:DNA-3-methyladenine glycosylase [Lachnospiraceae bacterium ZAX-1]
MYDMHMQYFEYGKEEMEYLKSKDPILGAVIDEIGHIDRAIIPDMFMALLNSIIGQQISTKAQTTIWARMQDRFSPLTPENIGAISPEELQTCGISMRKASYIREIADKVLDGSLDLDHLHTMADDEVCKRLCQIKGIGVWTAQMLMTFSMQRMDIISFDDLAIQRGLRMLYHHRQITPKLFAKYKRRYTPYATIASLYLWAIAGGACANLVDYAPKTKAQKKLAIKHH